MDNRLIKLKEELTQELDNILHYWIENTQDTVNGGFIGHVDYPNIQVAHAPKGAVLNARILWTFSAAYRLTKNQEYLTVAQRAYQYIIDHFIDKQYGGVYWELDYKGEPLNKRKQIYAIAFTIYGMAEFLYATGNEDALHYCIELFELIEKYSFDWKNNGYFEALTEDWKPIADLRLSAKDANESKTMNTHLHILEAYTSLYRVWKTPQLKSALENLIKLHIDKFINPKNHHLNLFFDDNWNLKSDEISFGHDIECAWLLYEAAEVYDDEQLLKQVAELSVNMAKATFSGLAADDGLINEAFPSKNKFDTDKHWWQQAEALVGFYNAYLISNNELFLDKTLSSWGYIKKHIIDHDHGEWFWKVNEQNVPYPKDEKAGFWKCPYHNSRACMELIKRI